MLDLNKMEQMVDNALAKETPESLKEFLEKPEWKRKEEIVEKCIAAEKAKRRENPSYKEKVGELEPFFRGKKEPISVGEVQTERYYGEFYYYFLVEYKNKKGNINCARSERFVKEYECLEERSKIEAMIPKRVKKPIIVNGPFGGFEDGEYYYITTYKDQDGKITEERSDCLSQRDCWKEIFKMEDKIERIKKK
jgi:hypothetical protein